MAAVQRTVGPRYFETDGGSGSEVEWEPAGCSCRTKRNSEVVAFAARLRAKLLIPVADQFYGDRSGRLADPFGHLWIVATHKEDVSPQEMQERMDALLRKKSFTSVQD